VKRFLVLGSSIGLVLLSTGCATNFTINPPVPSSVRYVVDDAGGAQSLAVVDEREGEQPKITDGRGRLNLIGLQEEPMEFLARHVSEELTARGIDTTPGTEPSDHRLRVQTFQFRHQQASGFTPFHTMTKFAGVLEHDGTEHVVTAYFKNGKVLVWSIYEAEEPNYNIAVSLIVKEIATKINRIAYGVSASDDDIQRTLASIEADSTHLVYQRVFELGYSNSPIVMPHLRRIAVEHDVRLARAAAISSIGMLKATSEFDFLVGRYESTTNVERAMALKSIGDLETPEAEAYLGTVAASKDTRDSMIRDVLEINGVEFKR
jgi:hypothetical protein